MSERQSQMHTGAIASDEGGKRRAGEDNGERTRERPVFVPRVDIHEADGGLVIKADLPGVRSDGLDIELDRQVLTIRGRVEEDAPEGFGPLHQEYEIGDFERRFTLSGGFDRENIEADLQNGVLTLMIPKAPEPEAKRIQVKGK